MRYLDSFKLASESQELDFILGNRILDVECYSNNVYPFKIFPIMGMEKIKFEEVTILSGGNGSGKSTFLNIMSCYFDLKRRAPYNYTPFFEHYLELCSCELSYGKKVPSQSKSITSDDVFDFLLDIRSINQGIDKRRDDLFKQYREEREHSDLFKLGSLSDYDELKRRNEARSSTKSSYVSRRMANKNFSTESNGETAFDFFTQEIKRGALYLLDEPENSLSPLLQMRLADFISESVRFYDCQFVISTHSPFMMAIPGAVLYDLDSKPVCRRRWTELPSVKLWNDFFSAHRNEFD